MKYMLIIIALTLTACEPVHFDNYDIFTGYKIKGESYNHTNHQMAKEHFLLAMANNGYITVKNWKIAVHL